MGIESLGDADQRASCSKHHSVVVAALAELTDTLVSLMTRGFEENASGADQRVLTARLLDPTRRSDNERLHAEMFEQLAPATEEPVVNSRRTRRGRLVFGDADE